MIALAATALHAAVATASPTSAESPALTADPVELEGYVVTGTRTRQAIEVAPVQVQVVGSSEIERLGGRSFADAMEYVPGVQVESNCQNCNTTDIRMMGLDGNYNQIAFDGLPMLSSLAGVYGVEQVPAAFIDRIEVVKGGGSSLYGANAVAGVINIVPRTVRESGISVDYRIDSTRGSPAHTFGFTLDHASPDRGFTGTAVGQFARIDPVDLNDDGYTEITRRRMEVAGLRAQATLANLKWTAELNHTHEFRRGGNRLEVAPHLANITEQLETNRTAATLAVESQPGGDFDFKAVLATAFTRRDSYYGGLGDVVVEPDDPAFDRNAFAEALAVSRNQYGHTKNPLHVADIQFNHRLTRRTLSWGFQAEYEEIDDRNLNDRGEQTGKPPLIDDFSNIAFFIQDDWTPVEAWTFLTGARADKNNKLRDPVVSPRLAVRYVPSRYITIRGSVATGFRSPRIFDEDLHVDTLGAEPVLIVNAPDLKKETAVTGNLGAIWNPPAYAEKLAFEANLFTARIADAFTLSEIRLAPDGTLFQERFNTGGRSVHGIEFNTAYSFTRTLRADLGVVFQRTRLDSPEVIFDDGAGTIIQTDRLNKTPEQLGVLRLQNEDPEGIDWALGVRYIGPMRVLNNNAGEFRRTPAFTIIDCSVGKHVRLAGGECEIRLGVQNLTDARQKDLESGANRDSDYVYGPRLPRTFFAQVKWRY